MNDQGLVVEEGKAMWVNMYSNIDSKSTRRITLNPDPENGYINTTIRNTYTEIDAYLTRSYYENDVEKIKKELSEDGFEAISQLQTENFREKDKVYKINFEAQTSLDGFDDKLLIAPFLHYPPKENLLKQKKRTYPVDFIYKRTSNYGSQIIIPNGYQVVDLPENLLIDNKLVKILYDVVKEEQVIKITGIISYKKSIYEPADYKKIKQHIDTIVEKFNEQILLEKM